MAHRRHVWLVTLVVLTLAFIFLAYTTKDAAQAGTPAPSWYVDLMLATGAAAVVALAVEIAYSVALHRQPTALQQQAVAIEQQRIRQVRWTKRLFNLCLTAAIWLANPIMVGLAVIGAAWILDGVAILAGARPPAAWAATSIQDKGDAAVALVIGLLFVLGGVGFVFAEYVRVRYRWWPRYLQRRADKANGRC
jgi:uncharacterized membrane protein